MSAPRFPVFMDPAERHPVGSPEWAGRISARLHHEFDRQAGDGFRRFAEGLVQAAAGEPWLAWPPDRPWGDRETWCRELFGRPWASLLKVVGEIEPAAAEKLCDAYPPLEPDPDLVPSEEVEWVAQALLGHAFDLESEGRPVTFDGPDLAEHIQRLLQAAALLRAEGR